LSCGPTWWSMKWSSSGRYPGLWHQHSESSANWGQFAQTVWRSHWHHYGAIWRLL
jgi:hypothetical protein